MQEDAPPYNVCNIVGRYLLYKVHRVLPRILNVPKAVHHGPHWGGGGVGECRFSRALMGGGALRSFVKRVFFLILGRCVSSRVRGQPAAPCAKRPPARVRQECCAPQKYTNLALYVGNRMAHSSHTSRSSSGSSSS